MTNKLGITELVLRDGHQSLLATRMRIDDMLPILEKLDQVGFWSVESWGGATFDSCIRFLGEDPWERLRQIKSAMPNTPQQMLFRGQNILGYRHYADDVVEKFIERSAANGMDIFRIFDAMNDVRNLETAIKATIKAEKHAQGTICYTSSPAHTLEGFVDMAKRQEDLGCHSICIKDMAGLLKPYVAFELVSLLKEALAIPVHLHSHATTGMSTTTHIKAVEAGVDVIDTTISSMAMTYSHSATESIVAILEGQQRDTGLDIDLLEEIASYFREVRKKYAKFEGSLKGVDSRILVAQVPGGMLTNMENQLREQGSVDKMDEVLEEIPRVRKDLGYIPLVTPTSQIVGTQSVINVLTGERYKNITKETAGILRGEYGATPAPVNKELQQRVLEDGCVLIEGRPADRLEAEYDKLADELSKLAKEQNLKLAECLDDDVLIYAQFPQVGLKFLKHRDNPDVFEPVPGTEEKTVESEPVKSPSTESEAYNIRVNNISYDVVVTPSGKVRSIDKAEESSETAQPSVADGLVITAPLAGTIYKINATTGQQVNEGDVVIIIEAMKMETEVRAQSAGTLSVIHVKEGDSVHAGDALITLA